MMMNPHVSPVSQMMALTRFNWAQGWTETNSPGYWLKEAQVQVDLDKPGSG